MFFIKIIIVGFLFIFSLIYWYYAFFNAIRFISRSFGRWFK